MTTQTEALKLALEALESSRIFVTSREKIKHPEGTDWYDERITAIEAALAQPEQEPVADVLIDHEDEDGHAVIWLRDYALENGRHLLYTTPPQIEVGCAECGVGNHHALYCVACAEKFVGEATTKLQQKQETIEGLNRDYDLLFAEHQLLLKKEWIGLTDDDKVLIKHDANFNQFTTAGEYADRVQQLTEARLKDKNTK